MEIEVLGDAAAVARRAAGIIASAAREAVAARGCFIAAVSAGEALGDAEGAGRREAALGEHPCGPGGRTGSARRTHRPELHPLAYQPARSCPLRHENIHAMPVEAPDLEAAAKRYARALQEIAGSPPVLDLVHLGLGRMGTPHLSCGDPALEITDSDVAMTGSTRAGAA